MSSLLKISLFLLLTACGPISYNAQTKTDLGSSKPIVVRIDDSFNFYSTEDIENAIDLWEVKTNIKFKTIVVDTHEDFLTWQGDKVITIYYAKDGWKKKVFDYVVHKHYNGKKILGLTFFPSRDIFIVPGNKIYKVAIHEFGHVLNCGHSKDKFDIMFPYIHNGSMIVSNDDANIANIFYKKFKGY